MTDRPDPDRWLRIARSAAVGMFCGLLAFTIFGLIVFPRWATLTPEQRTLAWVIWWVTVAAMAVHAGWLAVQVFRRPRTPVKPWEQIGDCGCGLAPDYGDGKARGVVPCPVHARLGPPDIDD